MDFLKNMKPAVKMFLFGCLTIIILTFLGLAAYTGHFEDVINWVFREAAVK